MELPVGKVTRKEFWINHIKAAEKFKGTNKEYCRINGIKMGSLSAYRRKFGFSMPRKKKVSIFSTVEVVKRPLPKKIGKLPDPKWLADFLRAWGQR